MCQYSSVDGMAQDWHLVHLGSRAVGGAALVMVEATAVQAEGRISPEDMGIWADRHVPALARIAEFVAGQNSIPAMQLAHAGRKACTRRPWEGGTPIIGEGQWTAVAPSAIPFSDGFQVPHALTEKEIEGVVEAFAEATKRSVRAGFQCIEIHAAHGYLLHEFLSPISNHRDDRFGGSLENRMRLLLMVAEAVRSQMDPSMPLFARISASDWAESGGWDLDQSIELCKRLKPLGVDLIDCSSGGTLPKAKIPLGPGYQVPFAEAIKRSTGLLTGAVGLITRSDQANQIIEARQADIVLLAREFLRDPYWALHAARDLGANISWPSQYLRAQN
jgi:2,4-dienoyl-CoA reductase-like NADH-dependent reductase (Old Yellow Enzyme family)